MEIIKRRNGLFVPILAVAVGATSCSRESAEPASDGDLPERRGPVATVAPARPVKRAATRKTAALRPAKAVRPTLPERKPVVATEDRTDLSPSDRKTLLAVEKALEDEDLEAARAVAKEALRASSSEVRSECVDMLGWFDEKTLPELTPFLSDPDGDVAENALSVWTRSLGQIESEKVRCETVEGVMRVLKDPEALDSLMMEVNDCDEALRMQMVVDLIGCGNDPAATVAREHYEFMTGEEFTTVEAAERWLRENKSEEDD